MDEVRVIAARAAIRICLPDRGTFAGARGTTVTELIFELPAAPR